MHVLKKVLDVQWQEYITLFKTLGNGYPEERSSSSQILLWAILANRKEIAEVCWLRGEELLCKFEHYYKLAVLHALNAVYMI